MFNTRFFSSAQMFPFGRHTKGVNMIEMPQQSEQMRESTWHLSVNHMGKQRAHIGKWRGDRASACCEAARAQAYLPLPAYRAFLHYLQTIRGFAARVS